MPRFQPPHFEENLRWHADYVKLADDAECSPAQLSLAWTLAQGEHVHVIPGTTSQQHLADNLGAGQVALSAGVISRVGEVVSREKVSGARYNEDTQLDIDTEEFQAD